MSHGTLTPYGAKDEAYECELTAGNVRLRYRSEERDIAGGWWLVNEADEGIRMTEDDVERMLGLEFERRF